MNLQYMCALHAIEHATVHVIPISNVTRKVCVVDTVHCIVKNSYSFL